METLKVLNNFLPQHELDKIPRYPGFNPFRHYWYDSPPQRGYQSAILEEASSFVDLSEIVGFEEWFHNPSLFSLPGKHYDKDEMLYNKTKVLSFPLCSCVFYMKVEDLNGANLEIEGERPIIPTPNTLVIFKPGVLHEVTPYRSGTRTSLNINPWNRLL